MFKFNGEEMKYWRRNRSSNSFEYKV